jgi:hypothetical protein
MMRHSEFCRSQAKSAQGSADAATLENVRERFLLAASTWDKLATQAERVDAERVAREARAEETVSTAD